MLGVVASNKISIGEVPVNTFFGSVNVLPFLLLFFWLLYLVYALLRRDNLFFLVFEKLICFDLAFVPVVHVVEHVALPYEELSEELSEVCVVGFLLELELLAVEQVLRKFARDASAQRIDRDGQLLLQYFFIFLFFSLCLDALPRERALQEVDKYVPERL